MYFNIMRGKQLFKTSILILRVAQRLKENHTSRSCYEHTRFRKKPPLGSRYLTDPNQTFEFNAW